jgi:hypothetical protein
MLFTIFITTGVNIGVNIRVVDLLHTICYGGVHLVSQISRDIRLFWVLWTTNKRDLEQTTLITSGESTDDRLLSSIQEVRTKLGEDLSRDDNDDEESQDPYNGYDDADEGVSQEKDD